MEKSQIWTIVGISLVVAVIASVATVSITGRAVNVPVFSKSYAQVYKTTEVYNKSEINNLLAGVNDEIQDLDDAVVNGVPIYNLFNKGCVIYSVANPTSTREVSGDTICQEREAGICVFTVNSGGQKTVIERCGNSWPSNNHVAYCCKMQ